MDSLEPVQCYETDPCPGQPSQVTTEHLSPAEIEAKVKGMMEMAWAAGSNRPSRIAIVHSGHQSGKSRSIELMLIAAALTGIEVVHINADDATRRGDHTLLGLNELAEVPTGAFERALRRELPAPPSRSPINIARRRSGSKR